MLTFDPKIDFGTILQTTAILGGGIYFVWRMQERMIVMNNTLELFKENLQRRDAEIKNQLDKVDIEITALNKNVIDIARLEERMNSQDLRIQELSNRTFKKASTRR